MCLPTALAPPIHSYGTSALPLSAAQHDVTRVQRPLKVRVWHKADVGQRGPLMFCDQLAVTPGFAPFAAIRRVGIVAVTGTERRITAGICERRNGIQGSVCTAAILSRSCPLWVKSRHRDISNQCPLYPQKRTLKLSRGMSALCQKR